MTAMIPTASCRATSWSRTWNDMPHAGKVLVIGSGQSGCQIAEELALAGREVFLACGRSPWLPRRVGGRDIYWWATETGFMDTPLGALADPVERLGANPQLSGHDGGHDMHFRTLDALGVTLLGHFTGTADLTAYFAPDLRASIAFGDQIYQRFSNLIRGQSEERGISVDDLEPPPTWDRDSPESLDLSGFGAVVVASGYRPDYRWMELPETLDPSGSPSRTPAETASCRPALPGRPLPPDPKVCSLARSRRGRFGCRPRVVEHLGR